MLRHMHVVLQRTFVTWSGHYHHQEQLDETIHIVGMPTIVPLLWRCINLPHKTPLVMMMSIIRQQLDMRMHDVIGVGFDFVEVDDK